MNDDLQKNEHNNVQLKFVRRADGSWEAHTTEALFVGALLQAWESKTTRVAMGLVLVATGLLSVQEVAKIVGPL